VADIVFDAPSISKIDIEAGRLCSFIRVRELGD
jgi:hypothetical protein